MTPTSKIMREILLLEQKWGSIATGMPLDTDEQVDAAYTKLHEKGNPGDYSDEIRQGDCETGLPCESNRNYETKSVAMKTLDGSWVGWTYYYGGGKHGAPGRMPWLERAYNLDVHEEEKVVTVRTFTKREDGDKTP